VYYGAAMALLAPRLPASPKEWSDADLLRRVLRNDTRAWNEMVRRFRSLIYRCVTKVIGRYDSVLSSADADEVYAEVMVSLVRDDMRKLRLYDSRRGTKLSSWLGMIATNTAYDFLRGTARRPILDRIDGAPDIDSLEASPLDEVLSTERRSHLNVLLADYSDKDRAFVSLYYAQGLPAEEVAEEMKISIKTVYSKKHKLLARLQTTLAPMMQAASPLAPA
jgi:RNA polymerase sigma-70 factor, ECF subfamily